MNLTDDQLKNYTLCDLEEILHSNGSSMMSICPEICPSDIIVKDGQNKLIMEELNYDKESLKAKLYKLLPLMTAEQTLIYNDISRAIKKVHEVFISYTGRVGQYAHV